MKKALVILLALVMVASLFIGCQPSATTSPTPDASPVDSGTPSAEPSPEPVDLLIMTCVEVNLEVEDLPLKPFFEEKTNTNITFDFTPESAYKERLQILLSTGDDRPDLFWVPDDALMLHDMAAGGQLYALDDLLATTSNIYPYVPEIGWVGAKPLATDTPADTSIYAIPKPIMNRQDGFDVRADWLETLGITIPADDTVSLDQFNEILRRFTEDDPDGNSVADTYGLMWDKNFFVNMAYQIDPTFGTTGWRKAAAGPYTWMNAQYDQVGTGYKEKVAWHALIWANGWCDPNIPNNDSNLRTSRFSQGVAGVLGGNPRDTLIKESWVQAANPDAKMTHISWIKKTPDQQLVSGGIGAGTWSWMAIFDNGDPTKAEASIKLLDYIYSDEGFETMWNGFEGTDYVILNGEKSYTQHAADFEANRYVFDFLGRGNAFPRAFLGSLLRSPEELERTQHWVENGIMNISASWATGFTPASAREQALVDYVANVWNPGVSAIISGQASIDTLDGIVQGWYDAGGTQVVVDYNAYLDQVAPADTAVGY